MFFNDNRIGKELDGWQMVYSTSHSSQAQMASQLLMQGGIESVIYNRKDSMYQAFGEVEVYVSKADFERAKEIIGELEL